MVAPKCAAWSRMAAISSGPMMPLGKPGKFSTAVVSINCPPASSPSINTGFRLARAVYSAAVSPAGPDPMMTTFSDTGSAKMLVEQAADVFLAGQPDDRVDQLT